MNGTTTPTLMRIRFSVKRDGQYLAIYGGTAGYQNVLACLTRTVIASHWASPLNYSACYFQRIALSSTIRRSGLFARAPRTYKLAEIKEPLQSRQEAVKRFNKYQLDKRKEANRERNRQKRNRRASARRKRH